MQLYSEKWLGNGIVGFLVSWIYDFQVKFAQFTSKKMFSLTTSPINFNMESESQIELFLLLCIITSKDLAVGKYLTLLLMMNVHARKESGALSQCGIGSAVLRGVTSSNDLFFLVSLET